MYKIDKNNKTFSRNITKLCKSFKNALTNSYFMVQYKVDEYSILKYFYLQDDTAPRRQPFFAWYCLKRLYAKGVFYGI